MKASWIICNLCEGFESLKNVHYYTHENFYNHCIGFHNIPIPQINTTIGRFEEHDNDEPDI